MSIFSNLKWIILGLVLASVSGVVSQAMSLRTYLRQRQATACQADYQLQVEEYCQEYHNWLQLPVKDQLTQEWGSAGASKRLSTQQRRTQQRQKLAADLEDLATGRIRPDQYADVIYGDDWQQQLTDYIDAKTRCRNIRVAANVALILGILFVLVPLGFTVAKNIKKWRDRPANQQADVCAHGPPELQDAPDEPDIARFSHTPSTTGEPPLQEQWTYEHDSAVQDNPHAWTRFEHDSDRHAARSEEQSVQVIGESDDEPLPKVTLPPSGETQKGQSPTNPTRPSTDDHLGRLSQEVTALREYAASQQDHIRKLQDGYDWNILKNFCLRFIRCVDNLDNRIERLAQDGDETVHLDDLRDELVFSLESSGVEQFTPELQSEYRGQERHLEVLKDHQFCDDPKLDGKIAQVVRPGYQYVINDDNIKVVRAAQVRIYQLSLAESLT